MKILVIGGDGYMGWPLVCQLSCIDQLKELVILDNLITRKKVRSVGGNSLTPISSFIKRTTLLENFNSKKIKTIRGSVTNYKLLRDLLANKFDVIYHLGHLRTAPYSMKNHNSCVETVFNNEIGFLNIIWALKEVSRDSLLIKLGSFGAYAPINGIIPEGDISLFSGEITTPFPKQCNDFYHITKANDSLFARAACNNWGLKIIDVMQSTVFGLQTNYTRMIDEFTRFDYDEIYGTVINRFIVQGIIGIPLTIYGHGNHSSGIMVLKDSINSLIKMSELVLNRGEYVVINNNPASYKIIDLANRVKKVLHSIGYEVEFSKNKFDPRNEKKINPIFTTTAEHKFIKDNIQLTDINDEILDVAESIKNLAIKRVRQNIINPSFNWG